MLSSKRIESRPGNRHLMVALHGLGDSLEGYLWLPSALDLPWLDYLLVNAPDPYHGGYSWYDLEGDPGPGVERSRAALFQLLDSISEEGREIFLLGFSQGCLMTWEAGVRYPRTLAGCIGISGYHHQPAELWAAASPAALERSFLATHGTEDPLIPVEPVRRMVRDLQGRGLRIRWREFPKGHAIAGEEEIGCYREFLLERREATSAAGGR